MLICLSRRFPSNGLFRIQINIALTLENIIYHTNAVSRGFKKKIEEQPLVVSDMPFLTYQCGEDKAVEYAGKIIQNTYAKAVKVEGAEPEFKKLFLD